jgi:hypothetical protein
LIENKKDSKKNYFISGSISNILKNSGRDYDSSRNLEKLLESKPIQENVEKEKESDSEYYNDFENSNNLIKKGIDDNNNNESEIKEEIINDEEDDAYQPV